MKITLLRVLTVAGLLAMSHAAHATEIWRWIMSL
jgi:hypothetical protein